LETKRKRKVKVFGKFNKKRKRQLLIIFKKIKRK